MAATPAYNKNPATAPTVGQRLKGLRLASCLRSHGDAVGDGMPQQLGHRAFIYRIPGEATVLGVPFQQALPFHEAPHPMNEAVGQLRGLTRGRRLEPEMRCGTDQRLSKAHLHL